MLFLDGVYADNKHGTSGFHRLKAPTNDELIQLTHTIAHRVGRYLERQGLLVRDSDQSYLTADAVDADIASTVAEFVMAIFLIAGSKPISRFILKIRRAGM